MSEAQLGLFNEAESALEQAKDEQDEPSEPHTVVKSYQRGTPKRQPLPSELERVNIEHSLPEHERLCPTHGVELERFGQEESEQLDIVPASVCVLHPIRGKYRCPCCTGLIRTAPMPPQPIPKSLSPRAWPAPVCWRTLRWASSSMRCHCIDNTAKSPAWA